MTASSVALLAVLLGALLLCVKPLGLYIANVMEGRPIWPLRAGAGLGGMEVAPLDFRHHCAAAEKNNAWRSAQGQTSTTRAISVCRRNRRRTSSF